MADDMTYEGWSNRETWCANLWLANDQGLYNMARGWARHAWEYREDAPEYMTEEEYAVSRMADSLDEWFSELAHGDGEDDYVPAPEIYKVLSDIGSLYRVNWREIAKSWVEEAREEGNAR